MANDFALYVRRAGISRVKASPGVSDLVAARVYPPQRPAVPIWPFVAWGVETVAPFEASCLDGARIDFALHCYAATSGTGAGTRSGEEVASNLAALAVGVLIDAGEIDLTAHGSPVPAKVQFTWTQTQVIADAGEADAFHAIASMVAHVAA